MERLVLLTLCTLVSAVAAGPVNNYDRDNLSGLSAAFRPDVGPPDIGAVGEDVRRALSLTQDLLSKSSGQRWQDEAEKNVAFCSLCNFMVETILVEVAAGVSPEALFDKAIDTCNKLDLYGPVFCEAVVKINEDTIFWVFNNTMGLQARDVCRMVFSAEGCNSNNAERMWEVPLTPKPKSPFIPHDIPSDGPTIKVLHLADTHFDPEYTPGSNAVCDETLCCRGDASGPVLKPEDAAGYWGDYRKCDSTRWTLKALYTQVLEKHPDISFIIWTGDLVPHAIWNTSVESNLNIIREAVHMVQEYFPGIPVYPAIGNHESHPVNVVPQPYIKNEFDISWLYDEIATLWQKWLPENVAGTIMYSGYYSVDVFPDLRILSVNSVYCYSYNWWLVYDSVDPGEGLHWLAAELQRAEDDGVFAYIISHVPSGEKDCTYTWSHQFNRIVARYEGVIAGIFYGHTHNDQYQIYFDPEEPDRAMEVAFVAQSQTTHSDMNPGYKVYTIDAGRQNATYTVLDHQNWYFDLDEANASNDTAPHFEILYTAKEEYGLADLSPQSHATLVTEMEKEDSPLFDLFYKNFIKAGRPYMERGCDAECKADILCLLLVSDNTDRSRCKDLRKRSGK